MCILGVKLSQRLESVHLIHRVVQGRSPRSANLSALTLSKKKRRQRKLKLTLVT
jgi:hypothetical protein